MLQLTDTVLNLFGPDKLIAGQASFNVGFINQIRMPVSLRISENADEYVRLMDRPRIKHSLLVSARAGATLSNGSFDEIS